jgi:hypothetical protein
MARVVPIVALIDQNPPNNSATPPVSHATVGVLTAIARLIEELPVELLSISGADYSDLTCSVESIGNSVVEQKAGVTGSLRIRACEFRDGSQRHRIRH